MSLDTAATKPHEQLAAALADDLHAVNDMIRARMASEHAPRIPEVTAHLVEAGGKRLRPMLTLAAARLVNALDAALPLALAVQVFPSAAHPCSLTY